MLYVFTTLFKSMPAKQPCGIPSLGVVLGLLVLTSSWSSPTLVGVSASVPGVAFPIKAVTYTKSIEHQSSSANGEQGSATKEEEPSEATAKGSSASSMSRSAPDLPASSSSTGEEDPSATSQPHGTTPNPVNTVTAAPTTSAAPTVPPNPTATGTISIPTDRTKQPLELGVVGDDSSANRVSNVVVIVVVALIGFGLSGILLTLWIYRRGGIRRGEQKRKVHDEHDEEGGDPSGGFHGVRGQTHTFTIDGASYEMSGKPGGGVDSGRSLGGGSYFSDKLSDNGTIFSGGNIGSSCNTSIGARTPGPEMLVHTSHNHHQGPILTSSAELNAQDTPMHAQLMATAPSLRCLNTATASQPITCPHGYHQQQQQQPASATTQANSRLTATQQKASALAAMEEGLLRHHMSHPLGSISPDDGVPILNNKNLGIGSSSSNNPIRVGPTGSSQVKMLRHEPMMLMGDSQPLVACPPSTHSSSTTNVFLAPSTAGPSAWSVGVSPLSELPPGYKPILTMSKPSMLNKYARPQNLGAPKRLISVEYAGCAAPSSSFIAGGRKESEGEHDTDDVRSLLPPTTGDVSLVDQLPASLI